jgi:hypothetical protein
MARPRAPVGSAGLTALGAGLAAAALGCGTATANATWGGPGGPDVDAGALDGATTLGTIGTLPDGGTAFCTGGDALVPLPDGECTGDIGKKTFLFAACACTTFNVAGVLTTDSLDSTNGTTPDGGASVGADTWVKAQTTTNVHGSVWAGGSNNAATNPAVEIDGDGGVTNEAHLGGDLKTTQPFSIGGDVYVSGDIFAAPTLTCGGAVHISPGGNTTNVTAAGGVQNGTNLVVDDPCDCSKTIDVGAIVAAFATTNDDAAVGLDSTSLASAPPSTVTLPCGRYYFDAIGGSAVSLALTGRTAIFVKGDVNATQSLDVTIAPGATLDLFVGGSLILGGDATIGDPTAPSRARVYVGGAQVTISGGVKLGANVYAPHADAAIAGDFAMAGAILVHSLAASGAFTVHYDVSILDVPGCQGSAPSCTTCHDCAGATPACKAGTCAPCVVDADCCAPLACRQGQCVANLK